MTGLADALAGNSYIGDNGDLYVGKSTLTSVGTTLVGMTPEVNIDFASNMYQLHADMVGLDGSVNVSQVIRDLTFMPAYHPRVPSPGQH